MLKLENNTRKDWGRTCDICQAAPCTVYCRADAASLCASCDSDIHTANPLARRHQRVPIMAHSDSNSLYDPLSEFLNDDEDDDESASWLNPVKNGGGNENGMMFGGDVDEYLDLNEYNSCDQTQSGEFSDQYSGQQSHYSGVPLKRKDEVQEQFFQLGLEFEGSNGGYNYAPSMCHNVSLSSMDVGVVPESARSDASVSHSRPPKGTIDLFSGSLIEPPTQLSPIDREARVMRYREKKKTRKFEKTIRYASRKAYAETRPRIKGRFAKRNDSEGEVDQMFSSSLMTETSYGVVPSF